MTADKCPECGLASFECDRPEGCPVAQPEPPTPEERARLERAFDEVRQEVDLHARIAVLEAKLKPFAALQIPKRPQGNAGFYSLFFKDIRGAKQALDVSGKESDTK